MSAPAPSSDPVFAAFCAAGLWPGLGKRTAADLPATGITSPDDVSADRLQKLPRVGRQRAERLFSSFLSARPTYEVVELLVGAGLNARLAAGTADALGPDAARRLRDDPWALLGLTGVTLADADRLAITVLSGADRQDTRRGRAIVGLTLRTATRDGHTVLPADLVVAALRAEGIADPAAAVVAAVESGEVLEHAEGPRSPLRSQAREGTLTEAEEDGEDEEPALRMLSLARYGMAEEAVAENVHRLAATSGRIADPASVRSVAKGLDPAQQAAVAQVLGAGVSLLTGGPGTGKSRTVASLVKLLEAKGTDVALAAPTGRAAKRLEELGIFAFTSQSLVGSTLYMLNHGLSTAALFIAAGYLIKRRGSRDINAYGGVQKVAPVLAGLLLFAGLSTLSLPGLSSFVSEFMVLAGTFGRHPVYAVVSTLAIVLAALYILIMYQRTMTGPVTREVEETVTTDLSGRERLAMAPLVLLIVALGVFPKPMIAAIEPTIAATMQHVGVTDPEPRVAAEGGR